MARSTGEFFSGTLAAVLSGQVSNFCTTIETELTAFQSNATDAWEEHASLTLSPPVTFDKVFRSLGDRTLVSGAGDANLFVRIQLSTLTIYVNAYQDWDVVAEVGLRDAVPMGAHGVTLSDTAQIDYWGVRNEYEFVILWAQSGSWYFLVFGSPVRSHIPSLAAGIARATANVVAGAGVTIALDRDISTEITVGQRVWVYDVVDPGFTFPLTHDNAEVVEVSAVTATDITVVSLANNHGSATSKAIVGLDPCPMYVNIGSNNSTMTPYFTNFIDAVYTGTFSQSHGFSPMFPSTGFFAGQNAPESTNFYAGVRAHVFSSGFSGGPSNGGFRGYPEHLFWWPIGTQVDGDRMIPNYDVAQAQKIFPSLNYGGASIGLAIGPGAT
jgi:hypothetical protein